MSAPDLIADYFTRNLDVSEDAALAALLDSSAEAAERFAALAAEDYLRLGLPTPVTPNPQLRYLKMGGLGLLALAALFAWWTRPQRTQAVAVGVVAQPDKQVALPRETHPRHRVARPKEEDASEETLQPRAQQEPRQPGGAHGVPRLSISMETRQGPFDVAVRGGEAQPVGVLDSAGNLVGRLVPSGTQAWVWDAKGKDGKPVAPGRYRVCLLADGKPLRQWVEIERR